MNKINYNIAIVIDALESESKSYTLRLFNEIAFEVNKCIKNTLESFDIKILDIDTDINLDDYDDGECDCNIEFGEETDGISLGSLLNELTS